MPVRTSSLLGGEMTPEHYQFLQYVQKYIEANPEVGAHVSDYVAQGIETSRKAQIAKSADMEIIISFLLRGGRRKLNKSDEDFVCAKLKKWSELCSCNWESMIKEWSK